MKNYIVKFKVSAYVTAKTKEEALDIAGQMDSEDLVWDENTIEEVD